MKRRLMALIGLLVIASLILSACAPAPGGGAPAAEEPAAEAPAAAEQPSSGLGDLPRNETLIADILTGRVGSPDDFNNWVGWKWHKTSVSRAGRDLCLRGTLKGAN